MNQLQATPSLSILGQLLEPIGRFMPLEFAKGLAEMRATPEVQAHIDDLAEKSNEGTITAEEQDEYRALIDAIDLISILQVHARDVIARHAKD